MNAQLIISNLIPAMWLLWALYWAISARAVKETVQRESASSRAMNIAPLVIGVTLIAVPHVSGLLFSYRLLPATPAVYWTGVAIVFVGLSFAIWARRHIGSNWSGTVTLKQNHALVRSGPYAIVRHPIYTGLLIAILGSGIARGELRGVWALALCTIGFVIKLRVEERWMRQAFGTEYDSYCAAVPGLVPFWPR